MQPLASRAAEPMREGLGHSLNFPASPSLAFTLAELTEQPRQAWSGSHQRGLGSAASLMSVHGSTPARTPTLSAVTGPLAGRAVWPPAGRASHKRRGGSHRRNVMWRSTRDPQWVTGEDEAFSKEADAEDVSRHTHGDRNHRCRTASSSCLSRGPDPY